MNEWDLAELEREEQFKHADPDWEDWMGREE